MMKLRLSQDRGHAQHGWLESYHTFSFSNYYDPQFSGFRALLVINEDRVQGGRGFGMHGHEDMTILSYVVEGALEHKDSLGAGSVLKPGDVQVISAGTGIAHSEFNGSKTDLVHFLQIWIVPSKRRLKPGYGEKHFSEAERSGQLKLIGSDTGRDGSVPLHQDVNLFASILEAGKSVEYPVGAGRALWLQLIEGQLQVNGTVVNEGDGLTVEEEKQVVIRAEKKAEFLLFDLGDYEAD
jgi:redox-sensitive bicupin YhaK (pirin superfamily)